MLRYFVVWIIYFELLLSFMMLDSRVLRKKAGMFAIISFVTLAFKYGVSIKHVKQGGIDFCLWVASTWP